MMQRKCILRLSAIAISWIILTSSFTMVSSLLFFADEQRISTSHANNGQVESSFQIGSPIVENGYTWWPFDDSVDAGTPAEAHITLSDQLGLTLVADFYGFWESNRSVQINETYSEYYDTVDIPGTSQTVDIGMPELPRLIAYVQVPLGVDLAIESVITTSTIVEDYSIAPLQPRVVPAWPRQSPRVPSPAIFDDFYNRNELYPSSNASLEGESGSSPIIMRGRRLLEVSFYPFQYNHRSHQLRVQSNMIVRLDYSNPSQIEQVRLALRSEHFEAIFRRTLLNYKSWNATPSLDIAVNEESLPKDFTIASASNDAAEYLIIVNETFIEDALRLAAWKHRTGLRTKVYTTQEIVALFGATGSVTSGQIKAFIRNAYNNWDPCPIFVLLFGDSEYIPTNYEMVHSDDYYYHQQFGYIGEDLHYFTVDGSDYIPDIFYGRISVDTVDEAKTVVDKILSYEKNPISDDLFYNNMLAAGFFEDITEGEGESERDVVNGDGEEDWSAQFIQSAEFVRNHLEDLGYIVHANYTANTTAPHLPPSSFWDDPQRVDEFAWPNHLNTYNWLSIEEADSHYSVQNITANINEGRFLVYHVDHGGSRNSHWLTHELGEWERNEGWVFPRFNSTHIPGLTNGAKLPLFINIDCSTGWFDGEIDQIAMDAGGSENFTNNEESLAELLLRHDAGGAIAVIAASRIIWNEDGQALLRGIIDAFWPGLVTTEFPPVYEMGAALYYGKMNVLKEYGYINPFQTVNATFRMYHLFGDPTTPLWTQVPSELVVDYPRKIGTTGVQKFVVKVSDVAGNEVNRAKVCLQMGTDVYEVGLTNFGYVEFEVNNPHGGIMNITVTHFNSTHNFKPYTGSIEIIESGARVRVVPERTHQETTVDITVFGFTPGLDVTVYFDNEERSLLYTGPSAQFSSWNVPDGSFGPINIVANQTNLDIIFTAVTVFYRLPEDRPDPLLLRESIYGGRSITIKEETSDGYWTPVADPMKLNLFQPYQVFIDVYNDGQTHAGGTWLDLYYHAFGVGLMWNHIDSAQSPGAPNPQPAPGSSWTATIDWIPRISGKTCLTAIIAHPYDDDISNNREWKNAGVLPVMSPGNISFYVGNPEVNEEYAFLELRQEGNYTTYWNASIRGYSSTALEGMQNESVEFVVDVPDYVQENEWRIFIVELYINGKLIEGIMINVTKVSPPPPPGCDILDYVVPIVVGAIALVVLVVLFRRRRS